MIKIVQGTKYRLGCEVGGCCAMVCQSSFPLLLCMHKTWAVDSKERKMMWIMASIHVLSCNDQPFCVLVNKHVVKCKTAQVQKQYSTREWRSSTEQLLYPNSQSIQEFNKRQKRTASLALRMLKKISTHVQHSKNLSFVSAITRATLKFETATGYTVYRNKFELTDNIYTNFSIAE